MIRIAIVDDVVEVCYSIENTLMTLSKKLNAEIITEHYYDGDSLCQDLSSGIAYDLILLDIELNQINGIQAAHFIRNDLNDELQQIVFISAKKQYSMELHTFHPLDFLVKPIECADLENIIKKYLKMSGKWNDLFNYKIGRELRSIKVKDIWYVTVLDRIVYLVLKNRKTIEYYGTLGKAYEEQLKKHDFLWVHKQYVVNPYYVKKYEYDKLILDDGTSIPIGSSRRKEIREYQISKDLRRHDL